MKSQTNCHATTTGINRHIIDELQHRVVEEEWMEMDETTDTKVAMRKISPSQWKQRYTTDNKTYQVSAQVKHVVALLVHLGRIVEAELLKNIATFYARTALSFTH